MVHNMGVMDKFIKAMKIDPEEDEYFDDDYLDDDEEIESAPVRKAPPQKTREEEAPEERSAKRTPIGGGKITPIKQPASRRIPTGTGMEVCVIKPTTVEDAREITETLLANRTVVLNLEGLDVDT